MTNQETAADTDESPETNSDSERPPQKTKTIGNGIVIKEAGDCRFVFSNSNTVHQRNESSDDEYDYEYHPSCGQRLPDGSIWGAVHADSPEEVVLKYDLQPCSKCFNRSYKLDQWRNAIHSNLAYSSPDDVPDKVLSQVGLNQYIDEPQT